ncbi:hypothetical protein KDA_15060 [Dictyobacter alpinus]|uniref:Major facilitator superfamily (MFS) profile domain-containing protein n=1 Tax=Dictyobacter alpinus TaxID=2014873 RepID=A0A402B3V2_9CHLR|nr:fused MFS/spermidine synthase [Dictyobacter alpinus]GCE26022.1 hypothetical protein KDA_15060 [Dictyobacter alpinus]
MATTTGSQQMPLANDIIETTRPSSFQGWLVLLLVFIAGAASLCVEMSATRKMTPYVGDSLFVWASVIGLILLYLTVGYYVGGILSDRHPRPIYLYIITAVASLFIGLIPLIADPILHWVQLTFASYEIGVLYGSLIAIMLLFAIPTILLGCVSPYSIRIRIQQVGSAGRTSGLLYATSTAGSILGTFLPVLVLLPYLGTNLTFALTAFVLFMLSVIGILTNRTA